uniref:Uncharacterized protein n=1 Tax=Coccolithus braarudii TaxID=221442 RepID=A0A7S0LAB1_9EUKA|mmetsp:Transcript_28179/g.60588  ORF Transcript_28179/g.60588 Transcript_28179/m.60588 type:complete len:147 (+) Transcript_28179:741-1181(+)
METGVLLSVTVCFYSTSCSSSSSSFGLINWRELLGIVRIAEQSGEVRVHGRGATARGCRGVCGCLVEGRRPAVDASHLVWRTFDPSVACKEVDELGQLSVNCAELLLVEKGVPSPSTADGRSELSTRRQRPRKNARVRPSLQWGHL